MPDTFVLAVAPAAGVQRFTGTGADCSEHTVFFLNHNRDLNRLGN